MADRVGTCALSVAGALACIASTTAVGGGCRIDLGNTPDDFGDPNGCVPLVGIPVTTQYVQSNSIVFGTSAGGTDVWIVADLLCPPGTLCRSGAPGDTTAFNGVWTCAFMLPLAPGVVDPETAVGVSEFSAELCHIMSPPGTMLMAGFDHQGNRIAQAFTSGPETETLTLFAAPGQLIATVRVFGDDPAETFGVAVDCLEYPDPVELGLTAPLDIKPGSCPNPLNPASNGVLPVGLLGTDEFDVNLVDLSSLALSRADGVGGSVPPNFGPPGPSPQFQDVGTPLDGPECDCHELGGDRVLDLMLHFKTPALVQALQLNTLPGGTVVPLVLSGSLLDGTPFTATDCVILVPPARPPPPPPAPPGGLGPQRP